MSNFQKFANISDNRKHKRQEGAKKAFCYFTCTHCGRFYETRKEAAKCCNDLK